MSSRAPQQPSLPRSYLFVPGHRADRFDKAFASEADAVVVDLEDAVAPEDKGAAREALATWLNALTPVVIRINGAETEWFQEDLSLLKQRGVLAVMLPKAESVAQIDVVRAAAPGLPLLPLVESGLGLRRVAAG